MTLADCTVMVVEDHEFQRRTTLQILANLGAGALVEAADGEGALVLLGSDPRPDIVVCDLDMPGMDGVEFLRRVSELCWYLAVCLELGEAHPWPIIVDEPFRQVDDPGRVLALLEQIAEHQQVIVLTANRTLSLRPLADLSAARG